ncbi:hypothetical protein F5Y16DRAFT_418791 [Xylariaceae sp. FL0255]|nr:hypothetical protein F5Y16DRAFT_418791 [Xylariaceae sp. FL0255]
MSFVPGPRSELPSSPWATRFPIESWQRTYVDSSNINHSILAPVAPRVDDPKYYLAHGSGTTGAGSQSQALVSDAEFDRMCWHEITQRSFLGGLRTGEAASLSSHVWFSPNPGFCPGGHRPADRGMEQTLLSYFGNWGLRVDETQWLPFLQKYRWYDWTETSPFGLSGPPRHWSVEEPRIWNVLKISIELAHRVLESLIQEKHESATSRQWRKRLIDLLDILKWGMSRTYESHSALAVTRTGQHCVILLSTEVLHSRLSEDLLPAENFRNIVYQATTILHELSHALMFARERNDAMYKGNRWDKTRRYRDEPFVVTPSVDEMGQFFEVSLFGGIMDRKPTHQFAPITHGLLEVPHNGQTGGRAPNNPFTTEDDIVTLRHVPLTWITRLISEYFWTDPKRATVRKSHNLFHRNSFAAVTALPGGRLGQWSPPRLIGTGDFAGDQPVLASWELFRRSEDNFRFGWFEQRRAAWAASPWSKDNLRRLCADYLDCFSRRDEIYCGRRAVSLAKCVRWTEAPSTYQEDLPTEANQAVGVNYTWHLVGLLMMASAPIRTRRSYRNTPIKQEDQHFAPSRAAILSGRTEQLEIPISYVNGAGEVSIGRSILYTHDFATNRVTSAQSRSIDPIHYIDWVDQVLLQIKEAGTAIHVAFFNAIADASQKLRRDREEIRKAYPNRHDVGQWASDWVFHIPDYDSTIAVWDKTMGDWEEVNTNP